MNKVISGLVLSLALIGCGDERSTETGQVHVDRGKAYESQGQYKAAVIEYRNAVKKSGGEESAVVAYAQMLNDLSQHRGAINLLKGFEGTKGQTYYLTLVESYLGLQKFQSAEKVLNENVTTRGLQVELFDAAVLTGKGELDEALAIYDRILASDGSNGDALFGKAGILLRRGSEQQARTLLLAVPKESDVYVSAQTLISGILISSEKLEDAESILTELLSVLPNTDMMQPEKAIVLERLSYVLTRLGRSNEAYIYTKLLSEAFPGVNEMNEKYAQAIDLFKAGSLEESQKILEALVADFPGNARASQMLGIVSYLRGDHEQAIEHFSDSIDPEVADPMATQFYVASSLKMNEPKKVLALLEGTIEQNSNPETLALYGLAAISDGQFSKGEESIKRAIELAPDNYKFHLMLATYYRDKETPDSGKELKALKAAHKATPTELQVLKDLMGHYLREKKEAEAQALVDQQLKSYQGEYSSQLIAGYFYAAQKNPGKAEGFFKKASQLETDGVKNRNALVALGRVQGMAKNYDSAKSTFELLIEKFPNEKSGYQGLFSVYVVDGIDKANSKLETLARRKKTIEPYKVLVQAAMAKSDLAMANKFVEKGKRIGNDEELDNLGYMVALQQAVNAANKREFSKARELIAPVLLAKPNNVRVLAFMVDLEIKAGNLQEAEKVLAQIKSEQANSTIVNVLSGDLAFAAKDYPSAQSYYEMAWKASNREVVADKLYRSLGIQGDKAGQSAFLKDWLAALPNSVQATLFKAMNDQSMSKIGEAKIGYEKVLGSLPNNVVALNNLGWLYFEEGKNTQSLDLLARAVKLAPESAAVLDSYGWVLVENNRVSEGLGYLEKAHKLAPSAKDIEDHLNQAKARL